MIWLRGCLAACNGGWLDAAWLASVALDGSTGVSVSWFGVAVTWTLGLRTLRRTTRPSRGSFCVWRRSPVGLGRLSRMARFKATYCLLVTSSNAYYIRVYNIP